MGLGTGEPAAGTNGPDSMGLPSNGFLKVALCLIDKRHMSPALRALASPRSALSRL